MTNSKTSMIFFLRAALIYLLLVTPWPGVRDWFGDVFRAAGQEVLGRVGGDGVTNFEAYEDKNGEFDTRIWLANRTYVRGDGKAPAMDMYVDSHGSTWLPLSLVCALVLATPVSWRRRLVGLGIGLAATAAFCVFRVWISMLWNYQQGVDAKIHLFKDAPVTDYLLETLDTIMLNPYGPSFAVAVVVWLAVMFRWSEIRDFFGAAPNAQKQTEVSATA